MAGEVLSLSDLDYARTTARLGLPDLVAIQRVNLVDDTAGGHTETWQTIYADVPARIAERSGIIPGQEVAVAGREAVVSGWVLTLLYDQDIQEKDRVVFDNDVYEVVFVNAGRSFDTARRCRLSRIS